MEHTKLYLPFGLSNLSVGIPSHNFLGTFAPRDEAVAMDETFLLAEALAHPVGSSPLHQVAR